MTQVTISTTLKKTGYELANEWHKVSISKDVPSEKERLLYVINKLLADQRLHAWDHERGGEMFHGAALVQTEDGNFYISANIHAHNAKTTRNCAEANAITDAISAEGPDRMRIKNLWFMGGRANLEDRITIIPKDSGRRYTPCASCCDAIWNHRLKLPGNVSKETSIHVLPLNDGSWKLKSDDGRPVEQLATNQVMTRSIGQLLPMEFHVADETGKLKESIRAGWEYIQHPETLKAIDSASKSGALVALNELKDKPKEEVLASVNKLMMDTVCSVYGKSLTPPKSMRVAVVRMNNGEFYMGTSVENGFAPATNSAEVQALDQATIERLKGHSLTDVFVLAVDAQTLPKILEAFRESPTSQLGVNMPDGATRERISKLSPYNGQQFADIFDKLVDAKTGASVHIIMPNNVTDFNAEHCVVSRSLQELLPYRYTFPKMDKLASLEPPNASGSIRLG